MKCNDYKYIVGLDLSLTEPGWAKYNVETKELTYGIIDVKKTKGFARINLIRSELENLFKFFFNDDTDILFMIEGYSFNSKGNSAVSLGELGGVIRFTFYTFEQTYYEVPPTSAKKFLTGKGSAQKSVIIKEVYKNYGIDVNNDNAADAINLCQIGMAQCGHFGKKLTKDQQAVLDKIFKENN